MSDSNFSKFITILIIVVSVAIIGVLGYFGFSVYNKYRLTTDAEEAVAEFEESASQAKEEKEETKNEDTGVKEGIDGVVSGEPVYTASKNNSGSTNKYYGYDIIGTISIPKIKIKYPILDRATTQSIKVAVAYLSGVGINKVGNTVIQGHNYRNSMFFSKLKKLGNGDKIYITDPEGNQVEYEVYSVFEAAENDASFYNRDTGGLREITLSTCTDDGKMRTIVLAKEVVG